MKKYILAALAAALCCIPAFAQNPTAVTGTILDPNSVPYYPAQVTACLTPNTLDPTVGGKHVNNNIGTNYCVGSVPTAVDGSFSMSLFANGNITPAATQWVFSVVTVGAAPPAGKGQQSFTTAAVTISGTSQSVTLSFTGLPALLNASSSGAAPYAPNMALYFTPQCQPLQFNCVSTFADTLKNNTCSWTNASTTATCLTEAMGVTAAVLALNVATYTGLFPSTWAAGNSITVVGYGAGDAFYNQTCTITTVNATTITCPITHATSATTGNPGTVINNSVGPFLSTDCVGGAGCTGTGVSKTVKGGQTCATDQGAIGGQISTTTDLTIATFISSTQVTLSGTPAQTATLSTAYVQGACLIYGHLDDAAAVTLANLMMLSPTCPKVMIAASYYLFSKPPAFFNVSPPACDNTGPGIGLPFNFANTVLSAGVEYEGRGTGNTIIEFTQSFPNGDPCNHKPTTAETSVSGTGGGCIAPSVLAKVTDMQFDGGPQSGLGNLPAGGTSLIFMSVGTIMNTTLTNMGYTNAGIIGLELGATVQVQQVNNAGFGGVCIDQNNTATGFGQIFRTVCENASSHSLVVQGVTNCIFCYMLGGVAMGSSTGVIDNFGSTLTLRDSLVSPSPGGGLAGDIIFGYRARSNGSVLISDNTKFTFFSSGGASNLNGSIQCSSTNICTNYLLNTTLSAQSAGAPYNDGTSASSLLYDEGGNSGFQNGSGSLFTGSVIGTASIAGTKLTAGAVVASANWGTGAAVSAPFGQTIDTSFTLTNGSAATGASPTLTYTFPTKFLVRPNYCTITQTGGTQAQIANEWTVGTPTTTSVVFTYNATPTINLTEIIAVSCH